LCGVCDRYRPLLNPLLIPGRPILLRGPAFALRASSGKEFGLAGNRLHARSDFVAGRVARARVRCYEHRAAMWPLFLMEACHAQASQFRRPPLLSTSRVSGGSHSLRKPGSNAAGASSTATSSWSRSSAATIYARAAPDAGFKACCMKSGRYDGANRGHYF